ncbi:hypothetical protein SAMN05216419_104124 [Nitrosomonas cryotolerans]|uniref:Uncharacterized protein n=1 Tax=Nitrosomonas cryotolerans ATCC 49181 TaxID=1131553 RepID=A0A1N6GN91_9PROT|nr:hypothetical protein [Nitrosomonas cryotolerans]SFP98118.1 hypothetical protein SAMN05216419_104124 [Nitrosomonas cryotolerans]SIO08977.1 hypothetical protein SAMN02743940_0786 [Nitrosomonas cryotolerans ATCC 49181]
MRKAEKESLNMDRNRKINKYIYLSLLVSLPLLTISFKSHAETYHGDFCWQILENEVPAWSYKLGVYEKEGGQYALYGTEDNGLGDITAAHGNAAVVGDNIKLIITGSGYTQEAGTWSETLNAMLSTSTLSGNWHVVGVLFDTSNTPQQYHSNGSIEPIACP